jgi:predicted dienelactone hydrolase
MPSRGLGKALVAGALVLSLLATVGGVAARTSDAASAAKSRAHAVQVAHAQPINLFFIRLPERKYGLCENHITLRRPVEDGTRTLETTIFYPRVEVGGCGAPSRALARFFPGVRRWAPLILFSHGLGAPLFFYRTLLTEWARAGYVVAAPEYPLSNFSVAGPGTPPGNRSAGFDDVVNQPDDAKFVIDRVISEDSTNDLAGGKIDPTRIGASGHSLGAMTTYGLAYINSGRDPRIEAAIAMSGCAGFIDGRAGFFSGTTPPLLILHGEVDPIIPLVQAQQDFIAANSTSPKVLLKFLGADHNAPFGGEMNTLDGFNETQAQATAVQRATVDWWDRYLKGDGSALNRFNNDINVPGGIQNVAPTSVPTSKECKDEPTVRPP